MKLNVQIAGPGRDRIEAVGSAFMREQFEAEPKRKEQTSKPRGRDGTVLPVVSLFLSVPGAVLAAMQISENLS